VKPWQNPAFHDLLKLAIAEDLQIGDATSDALIPDSKICQAVILAKSNCIVCGQNIAETVFHALDPDIDYRILKEDGSQVEKGVEITKIAGPAHAILAAERIALNFMQRMSGIASATNHLVQQISNTGCKVVDTRKTLPGHRILDKYAVLTGGGSNHRMNLGDGILIKDNHIEAVGSVKAAVMKARANSRHTLKIQIEVKTKKEAVLAVEAGADALLLDNMSPDEVSEISNEFKEIVTLECSGNITSETITQYANCGIHIISVGALTHSVMAADLSLLFQ